MKKLLTMLYIVQITSNKNRNPKLGRGFKDAYRFNPYNPLSYITIIAIIIVGVIMFGIVGFWDEVDMRNPFSWV